MCTVFMVTVATTACATGAYLLDMVAYKTDNKHSVGAEQLSRISDGLDRIAAFLNRVPDELELTHRCSLFIADHYLCLTQYCLSQIHC